VRFLALFFLSSLTLFATNWVAIQALQPQAGDNLFGFVQVLGQKNYGDSVVQNGYKLSPFSYIIPDLRSQEAVQIQRARLGARGSLDSENKINYFLLTEFGKNGITQPLGYKQNNPITDASLSFRQLPFVVRLGIFRYPGSEEGMLAQNASPFINFTVLSDQLLLERFIATKNSSPTNSTYLAKPKSGVGAYRDSGIEIFKEFTFGDKESLTLAYMLGNGSGRELENKNENHFTHYGYCAYEKKLGGGRGYLSESFKVYGWYQEGKRALYTLETPTLYKRIRYGVGATYYHNNLRLAGEYAWGEGMIFAGAKDTNNNPHEQIWQHEIWASKANKADGFYLLGGYTFFNSLSLLARYEQYHRLRNNNAQYRKFKTLTTALSYRIAPQHRLDFNYDKRAIEAPHNPNAQKVLQATGDIFSVQYTLTFM
jgi:predicted porin